MDKHKTVAELEYINDLIQRWKNAPDDEAMDALIKLRNAIERAYNDYLISEKMYNDYNDLFQDHIGHYIDNNELLESLEKKTNENINIVEQADDKIAKSLDLGERADDNAEHNVDSKTDLQYIKDVMNQYWHERDEKEGVLSAVDKFTEIGDAIKKALEEKKISRMTAVELMEPLRAIKDDMCDINKENDALDRFEEIIDRKLAREDERGSQNQQQEQPKESMLESAGTVIGRTIEGVTKAFKTIHDKTEEKAQRAADEYDRQQAQKEAGRNKSPLSPEQIEQFKNIKEEFLRRYQRAQVYHRSFPTESWPIGGTFWTNTVDAMEPLTNMFKGLDLKDVTDTKQLETLARKWTTTMDDMLKVYNWLDNQRAYDGTKYTDMAYDDVWGNMDEVNSAANQFFTRIGLNQQQEKAPQKKEYVKPETKVEQKQPQEPVMQQPQPRQPQEKVIMAPVPETPQGVVDSKEQTLERIAHLIDQYENTYQEYGSLLEPETAAAWKELTDAINYAVAHKLIPDDMANQLIDTHNFLKNHSLNSKIQYTGIEDLRQIIGVKDKKHVATNTQARNAEIGKDFYMGPEHSVDDPFGANFGKTQRAEDAPQMQEKSKDLMWRENVSNDKNDEKPHTMDSLNKAIENYTQSVGKHLDDDILNSWRALAKEINEAAKAGVISKEQADELHKPLKQVQNHNFQDEWHKNAVNVLNQWLENKPNQKDVPHETNLEKKQDAENAPQIQPKPKDLMRREDVAKTEKQFSEQPLKRITDLVNKYEGIYRERGSVLDDDVIAVWKELTNSINYAVENKLIPKDVATQLIDAHNFLRGNALNSKKQFEGINKFKQIIGEQSKQSVQEPQVHNEAVIARLRQIVDMFDRQNSDESFKKMMFALKEVADKKMVPDEMVDAYRAIFENVKKHGNTERGILDLSAELYNQMDKLQNPSGERQASEENTPRKPEKVMTREDVVQKESDLKPRSDKEIGQQTETREGMMERRDARPNDAQKANTQHRIKNFTTGNYRVQQMEEERDVQRKAALLAHSRQMLGRRTPGV